MGILLVGDERARGFQHQRRDMAVQVELAAQYRVRPHDLAQAGQQVAFAVVVALGDHGAVHVDEHEVERQRRPGLREDAVAVILVDPADRPPRRLGEGAEAFHHLMPLLLRTLAPDVQRLAEGRGRVAGRIAIEERGFAVGLLAGRQRREGVGLGPETGDEHAHDHVLPQIAGNSRRHEANALAPALPGRRWRRHNPAAPADRRTKGAASWKLGFTETPTVNPIATM